MKAIVTGGTGFVGSHVVRVLRESGHDVRVLHRPTSPLSALIGLEYESALGDVTEPDALRRAFEGCDWVFHVAAVADYWRADEKRMFDVNVGGTKNVLQAARETGVKRVIFTSSAAALGLRDDGQPADETVRFNLPPRRFPYAYSKALAEDAVAEAVVHGQDVVTVNPSIILGPADLNVISGTFIVEIARFQWLTPCTSGGAGFVDVRDVARWHLAAAEKGRMGERYILNTANYTHRTIYDLIARTLAVPRPIINTPDFVLPIAATVADTFARVGIKLPVDANQVRLGAKFVYFDASKTYAELGQPTIGIPQSIADAYYWYKEQGYFQPNALNRFIGWAGRRIGMG